MNERYVVFSRGGEAVVRTNSEDEAKRYVIILKGAVIDREKETSS